MNSPPRERTVNRLHSVISNPAVWCAIATADFIFTSSLRPLLSTVGDPDDAVRLVSVRELLRGASWFDTTLPRIGAPTPLVSHWSRLVDAPLAASIGGLTPFLGNAGAELATRILWPALLCFVLLLVVVREAHRRGGNWAALLALFFAMTSVTAFVQFAPGRIDHHNVMILCTISGLLFLERSFEDAAAGWKAGMLLGLALAIGYEPMAVILPALAIAASMAVWQQHRAAARAVTATALTMSLVLVATVRPNRWLPIHCDALALNLPLALACGAAGLWLASRERWSRAGRAAVAVGSLAIAIGVFAAFEPVCLRGPFAQVSPEIRRIWMDGVLETKSGFAIAAANPVLAWPFIVFAMSSAVAQIVQARSRRDPSSIIAALIMVSAFLLSCWQLKLTPYASWLAAIGLATTIARLGPVGGLSPSKVRGLAALLACQATWMLAFVLVRGIAATPKPGPDAAIGGSCVELGSFAPLARLAPGLVAADLELGPYIVVATDHRVVAGPYHRLEAGILANHTILTSSQEQAAQEIRRLGVNYIVVCQALPGRRQMIQAVVPDSLEARLLRNERIDFLEERTPDPAAPIRIWTVRKTLARQ